MRKLDFFLASNVDWWHWEGLKRVINDDAPPEAKESYKNYLEPLKSKTV